MMYVYWVCWVLAGLVEGQPEETFFQFVSGVWRVMNGDMCKVVR